MVDSSANSFTPPHQDGDTPAREYLDRAARAVSEGHTALGMCLFLAAFERASEMTLTPSKEVVDGLKRAWMLAIELGQRSIAEYIFDRIEPYLSSSEVDRYASELQKLTIDKLLEIGIDPGHADIMADFMDDFLGSIPRGFENSEHRGSSPEDCESASTQNKGEAAIESAATGDSPAHAQKEMSGDKATRSEENRGAAHPIIPGGEVRIAEGSGVPRNMKDPGAPNDLPFFEGECNYSTVRGYADVVRFMRSLGIGMSDDPDYREFIEYLNARHGLVEMPPLDSLLFRSPAREDANLFMTATAGEIGKSVMRMRMEENIQGSPVLCVISSADCTLHLNSSRTAFEGEGTLILEDLDLWLAPSAPPDQEESIASLIMSQLMRNARDTLDIIRTAVDDPHINVFASASTELEVAPIFLDLIEPFTCVDISLPTPGERAEIWMDILQRHPSLSDIDRAKLIRCSSHMARFDIYLAVRDAIEDAYKQGLALRRYVPVTPTLMFEKIAAFHPLESEEYRELEEAAVNDLRELLDSPSDMEALFSSEESSEPQHNLYEEFEDESVDAIPLVDVEPTDSRESEDAGLARWLTELSRITAASSASPESPASSAVEPSEGGSLDDTDDSADGDCASFTE